MNYLVELNELFDYCMLNKLSQSETILLHVLYMINNKKDWDTWFEADNETVQRLMGGYSREALNTARNKLKQRGRIDFKNGIRNVAVAKYKIISFKSDKKLDMKLDMNADIQLDTIYKQNKNKDKKIYILSSGSVKPTLDEIKNYCLERNNEIDAEYFFDFYEARGWVSKNGSAIKNWKVTIKYWEKNKQNWGEHSASTNSGVETRQTAYNPEIL